MMQTIVGPKKNTTFTFYFPLLAFSALNADPDTLQTAPVIHAIDFQVSIDGGAFANTTNLPTENPVAGYSFELILTAAEMNGNAIVIRMISTDGGGKTFRDAFYEIITREVTVDELVRSTTPANTLSVDAGNKVGVSSLAADTITAASIAADAIGASELATDAINEIRDSILADSIPFNGAFIDVAISSRAANADARFAHLDADVSSRADGADYTPTRAAFLDNLDALVSSRLATSEFFVRRNTAQTGGVSTIQLDAGASAIDEFYDKQLVVILSGAGAGQARWVTSYVGSTKTATVDFDWITMPDNTSVFGIVPHWLSGQFLDALVSSRADGSLYTSTRAAKIDNLDVLLSTREPSTDPRLAHLDADVSSRADGADYTNARATKLDFLDVAVSTREDSADSRLDFLPNLDVLVSSRADAAQWTGGRAALIDYLDAAITTRADAAAYTPTRAAKLDNLDAAVTTRADAAVYTSTRAAKLDNLDATIASRAAPGAAMTLASGAIDAAQVTAAAGNKLADIKTRRTYANVRASLDGDALNFRSELGMMAKLVNEIDVIGAQLIVKHENGATFGTQNLTTSPGAAPITSLVTT